MVETLDKEGGDDRDHDVAFQKQLEEIQNLPEYPEGFISDKVKAGIGDIVMVGTRGRHGIPAIAGSFSLRRSSVMHPFETPPPENVKN